MSFIHSGTPRALARLSSAPSFVCRQCLRQQTPPPPVRLAALARSFASARTASATAPRTPLRASWPLGGSKAFSSAAPEAAATASASGSGAGSSSSSSFPETNSKAVGVWLIGSVASVFGIVVFGGLTRLTESGLSITEWRPVTGSLPPRSDDDWESEFAKYRASPEFAVLNSRMTLDEFKKIYYMEWTHRLWGRVIGLTFVLPAAYFVARRRVTRRMAFNLAGISALIGLQGFIGWWMVKSGLRDDLFAPGSHPRVSQYRLAAHLGTAFVCYSWMLLSGLSALRARRLVADPAAAAALVERLRSPALRHFSRSAHAVTALVFVTAMSGALVAGLDAGLIYNEFPMMGTGLAPAWPELFDAFYSRRDDGSDLWWRNALENPSLVQLEHRALAVTTFCAVVALFAYSRSRRVAAALPPDVRKGAMGVLHLAVAQVALGISTLVYMVPTHLAATHQAGALALLTGSLVLLHRLRISKSTALLIQRRLLQASKGPAPLPAKRF
ncbi:electron transfer protein 1 [Gaeumannomyces tritici R3-111a-1]|uniref:Electron transfer protein 1 n=1 Tax=Gaeumannomyces tritici (strain R3-111a-1) TaxID=644352 RepID=J3PJP5_GAET3|nr:electron transfer protein 1 [Gaeumannomyces tritici R3-111a-1]EJT68695.1 electron transfer protein 1 [Gaeumannomyces tritici R3-111a-1]